MRYHFHCTDGWALILDQKGRLIRSEGDLEHHAQAVARRLMAEVLVPAARLVDERVGLSRPTA